MNTHLPLKSHHQAKPAILATRQKDTTAHSQSHAKLGKTCDNLSLRYPKDLERCFVLGNN